MGMESLLTPEGVITCLRARCKKNVLYDLSVRAARLFNVDQTAAYEALLEREAVGSTGFGDGVAIPHARLSGLSGPQALFARLETPVEFDAVDGAPVDLVFLLLAPTRAGAEHLKALAKISRMMRDSAMRERLRAASDATALYDVFTTIRAKAA